MNEFKLMLRLPPVPGVPELDPLMYMVIEEFDPDNVFVKPT